MKNKKGFTLIELLAVIVILGIILVIAIPSISAAILNARKNSYVVTANEFVDGLRTMTLTNPELLPSSGTYCIPISDIKLEKGSNTKSPFGKNYNQELSEVCVTYEEEIKDYIYSICLIDEGRNGLSSNNITTLNKSDVKIGDAACDGSSSGNGSFDREQISAGEHHTVALLEDGTVRAWGYNYYGQLGDGSRTSRSTPVAVMGLPSDKKVIQISAGGDHTIVLLEDGTVMAWGANYNGELGDGTVTLRTSPVAVTGLPSDKQVKQISAGTYHTVALLEDGTVMAWGSNYDSRLGNGNTDDSSVPVKVIGLPLNKKVIQISAGFAHTIALLDDGTAVAWGRNDSGQIGTGDKDDIDDITIPEAVMELINVKQISAGGYHTVALLNNGKVMAWGRNENGQLGNGTTNNSSIPVEVIGLTNVKQIATNALYTAAFLDDGTAVAWGSNYYGQLGNGNTTDKNYPVSVIGLPSDKKVIQILAGSNHTIALLEDGTVWAWGYNYYGQIGNGTTNNSSIPVEIISLKKTE